MKRTVSILIFLLICNTFINAQIIDNKKNVCFKPYQLKNVLFSPNNSKLFSSSFDELDNFYFDVIMSSNDKVLIIGHTDNIGSPRYNLRLSQKWTEQIKDYYSKQGYDVSNIYTNGCGEYCPISDNDTKIGRSKNRRIEVFILPDSIEINKDFVSFYKSLKTKHKENEKSHNQSFIKTTLFPIPSNEILTISGLIDISEFEIYSITGQLLKKQIIENGEVNISDLPKGIYIAKISNKENVLLTQKIIKQ